MASLKSVYICTNCGSEYGKWFGRCPNCGEWNTLNEEVVAAKKKAAPGGRTSASAVNSLASQPLDDVRFDDEQRYTTGISELDRVLGGGIVKGSVVLIGGEPGAGKSTLLLQMCGNVCETAKILYISGEESATQIKLRADRLGISSSNIHIAAETDVEVITAEITKSQPDLVIIDSIQTMSLESVSSSPGSVTQVRECTSALMRLAKSEGVPIFIVGHVNKDGAIAGPKVMEHIVDTVLYFEGERYMSYRILRAAKNRFGSTNEIGLFDMTNTGLFGVENPSGVMLDGRDPDVPGSCVTCIIEGSRPILAEVQSLASKTGFGTPRRTSSGFDYNRTNLLLAVLEKRAGYFLSNLDVYINVVGGLQMNEPSVDLSVAMSLVSAIMDKPLPEGMIAFGEIGLGGEIRSVANADTRVQEAQRLGFTSCVLPKSTIGKLRGKFAIKLIGVGSVRELGAILKD